MKPIERTIPTTFNKSIFMPLFGPERSGNEKTYLREIEKFEKKCEKSLIETLSRLSIHAMVKTDRYSLPYQKECEVSLYGESYMNGPYEFHRVANRFVKELLNEDVYKIRFYIFIEVLENSGKPFNLGKVCYKLRYYVH